MNLNFQRLSVKNEMVEVIDDFLNTISSRLVHYYKADVSSGYLERMTDHLKTFFDDIIGELEERSTALRQQIEGTKLHF